MSRSVVVFVSIYVRRSVSYEVRTLLCQYHKFCLSAHETKKYGTLRSFATIRLKWKTAFSVWNYLKSVLKFKEFVISLICGKQFERSVTL